MSERNAWTVHVDPERSELRLDVAHGGVLPSVPVYRSQRQMPSRWFHKESAST